MKQKFNQQKFNDTIVYRTTVDLSVDQEAFLLSKHLFVVSN